MAIPDDEKQLYFAFVQELTKELGTISVPPSPILWHYTNGSALVSIIETGTIYTTQLSGLNDTTELRYGAKLFREALIALRAKHSGNTTAAAFIEGAITYFTENTDFPTQSFAPFFVACFSAIKDDLSQWRAYGGGENGYAIGFNASSLVGTPNSMTARVNYDAGLHKALALKAAEKALEFFLEGIKKFNPADVNLWGQDFLEAFNSAITLVAPLVKDPAFSGEQEWRIVKGYSADDLKNLIFRQKSTLMARHLPIQPGVALGTKPYQLPIAEVVVGPSRHREITRVSVNALLAKYGYPPDLASLSKAPFQMP